MSINSRALIAAALAAAFAAALASGAQAYETSRRHHHHVTPHPVWNRFGVVASRTVPPYVDPGPSVDPGQVNRYFNDTRYPHYLLGPGNLQRFDDAVGGSY